MKKILVAPFLGWLRRLITQTASPIGNAKQMSIWINIMVTADWLTIWLFTTFSIRFYLSIKPEC